MKSITTKYLVVLGVLTLVILGSQILMQKTISESKSDGRIINISGRQRMLSQKIAKSSLKLSLAKERKEFENTSNELNAAYKTWHESHRNLKFGTNDLIVAEMNATPDLKILFQQIEPLFDQIQNAASFLSELNYDEQDKANELAEMVKIISENEPEFLRLMNDITFKYDELASAKNEKLSRWELILMALTFILIFIEVFLIFKPMLVESRKKDQKLSEINSLLEDNKSFSSSQIELANVRISKLRKAALTFKSKLSDKEKQYSLNMTDLMNKNIDLNAKIENYKGQIAILKRESEKYHFDH